MKSLKNSFRVIVILFVLTAFTVTSVSAITFYLSNGYRYRDITASTVALSGYESNDTELIIPEKLDGRTVISVDSYAFYGNTDITALDFSQASGLSAIGDGAFCECSSLQNVVIPSTVNSIAEMAFQDCTALETIRFDAQVSKIDRQMFIRCSSLTDFIVPDAVTSILDFAFADCSALERIVIPPSVNNISNVAFLNDPNLTIYCMEDSYAHAYAEAHDIPYVLMYTFILGDVDGNGSVNVSDVTTIQRYLAELDVLEGISLYASDANRDGVLDISDATAIQMYLAEYEIEYPIGEIITQ